MPSKGALGRPPKRLVSQAPAAEKVRRIVSREPYFSDKEHTCAKTRGYRAVAIGWNSFLRRYFADATADEVLRIIVPAVLIVVLGASFMLISAFGDLGREREVMRKSLARSIGNEVDLRVDTVTGVLFQVARQVRGSEGLAAPLVRKDGEALAAALDDIVRDARANKRMAELAVYDRSLAVLFDTRPPRSGGAAAPAALESARARDGSVVRLEPDASGRYALRVIVPWRIGDETEGFVEVAQSAEAIFADFLRLAHSEIHLIPPTAIASADPADLPAALRSRMGGRLSRLTRMLSEELREGMSGDTLDLNGVPHDVMAIRTRGEITGAPIYFVAIRDASAREAVLSQILIRRTLMWFVGMAVFVGTCLWLSLRLTMGFHRREQERFREREQRVGAVMDAVADAIVTIRADGTITTFNPAAETMFGLGASEAIGQNVRILMSSGLAAQHQGYIDRYLQTGQKHIIGVKREVAGRRKDGTEFPMDLAVSRSSIGGEIVFIGVMRDVTERKLANDLLLEALRHQKEAQQALRHRSDELVRAAKALARARDKAEAANNAKSRFLAAMSHELRTPMNGILGMAGLLASSPIPPEQRKWAMLIRESGEALLTLLNDILDLSKIEAGHFQIRPQRFDPLALARQLVVSWEHQAAEKGIVLGMDGPDNVPDLVGDAMRIRQILTNYMSNALKFTERGYITVKLSVIESCAESVRLRFDVADTGAGIPEDKIPLLFEKFNEIDIGASRRHNGAGLGLAICRETAGLMGGRVGVESVPGIGSVFWFELELPVHKAEEDAPADPDVGSETGGRSARPLRILVAEDHPVNQKLFQALIAHMEHEATIVANGEEAVAALRGEPFDLVLMDANMPVMDGAEATRRIRALPGPEARVPIIAVTAEAMVGDRERFLDLGMDDYLTKPIDARELQALITRYGGTTSTAASPAEPDVARPRRSAGSA